MIENIGDHVIYNNNQLIAVNKPCGIASQPDSSGEKSMIDLAEIYCKHKLFLVHRLDQPASGVLLFAKNKKAVADLHRQFKERTVEKVYWALVSDKPDPAEGSLENYLDFNRKSNKAFVTEEPEGKLAQMSYKLAASSENYHLLEIQLLTGRQHQIRIQLAHVGNPIRGDDKYGFKRGNKDRSIQLHARKLAFKHPVTGKDEHLLAPPPDLPIWNAFLEMLPSAE